MRFAFAYCLLLAQACTLPLDAAQAVEFQVSDELLLDTEASADQFRGIYPQDIDVTTEGEARPAARLVRASLVAPGFVAPGDTRPMCQFGVVGTARISGHTDRVNGDVWVCDDMTPERTRAVLMHEMCHVFGAPSAPHWEGEGGACSGRDDAGVITPKEQAKFKQIWKGLE